jgi:hypothetical protein
MTLSERIHSDFSNLSILCSDKLRSDFDSVSVTPLKTHSHVAEYGYPPSLRSGESLNLSSSDPLPNCSMTPLKEETADDIIFKLQNLPPSLFHKQFIKDNNIHHFHSQYTDNGSSLNLTRKPTVDNFSTLHSGEVSNFPSQATENWSSPSLRSGEALNFAMTEKKDQECLLFIEKYMPKFELSYETILHRKVFLEKTVNHFYDMENKNDNMIQLSIPYGKKFCIWITTKNSVSHFGESPPNSHFSGISSKKKICYLIEYEKKWKSAKHSSFIHVPKNVSIINDFTQIFPERSEDNRFGGVSPETKNVDIVLYGTIVCSPSENVRRFSNFPSLRSGEALNSPSLHSGEFSIAYRSENVRRFSNLSTLRSDKFIFDFDRVSAKTVNSPSSHSGEFSIAYRSENVRRFSNSPTRRNHHDNEKRGFIIEDVFHYDGIPTSNLTYGEKLVYIHHFLKTYKSNVIVFALPIINKWKNPAEKFRDSTERSVNDATIKNVEYPDIHHYKILKINQHSKIYSMCNEKCPKCISTERPPSGESLNFLESKPQEKHFSNVVRSGSVEAKNKKPAIFYVMADAQYDIYHLYAKKEMSQIDRLSESTRNVCTHHHYKKIITKEYYNVAYIPNIKTSIFMNSIFRNIRENKNIDYIEESDEEDNFEDISEDKYVDFKKIVIMECIFHNKFKKWVPNKVLSDKDAHRVINIDDLRASSERIE